jgi:predicted  nucleic acid-binding Zn-ribbon protein
VIVVLGGTAAVLYQRLQQRSADYTALQADEQATRDRYSRAIEEIAAIQDSLNAIVLGDEGARALADQLEAEKSLSQTRGDQAMARIASIRAGLERAKHRIQELDAEVQEGGVKIAGLEKMIQNLRRSVAEKEELIVQLTHRVEALQTQVAGLEAEVEEGNQTIEAQAVTIEYQAVAIDNTRRELGTVYYAIGTKKELKSAGLIVAKGGLLGIGRTLEPSGQIDQTMFTPMDTDRDTVIHIPAEKARVLSDQPPLSYELQKVGEQMELHILDPRAFRMVKHVIIMTT